MYLCGSVDGWAQQKPIHNYIQGSNSCAMDIEIDKSRKFVRIACATHIVYNSIRKSTHLFVIFFTNRKKKIYFTYNRIQYTIIHKYIDMLRAHFAFAPYHHIKSNNNNIKRTVMLALCCMPYQPLRIYFSNTVRTAL